MPSLLATKLLSWYDKNARDLPWRDHPDPYAVWVSEIMLQQTRVETVIPYYQQWMQKFPTLAKLAQASQQEVLAAWEGLGYYSRARNLHRAAQTICQQHHGELPDDIHKLRQLPGIGRYTAGAIASIAFGLDEPTLDGNIRRVLARIFNVNLPARSSQGEKLLWELAAQNLPTGQAGDYNQALMDLGATICTPQRPSCQLCPLSEICQSRELGLQEARPVLAKRKSVPHHIVTAAVIINRDQVLIAQRPQNGLLGGLWEFPGGKLQTGEDLTACLRREIQEELGLDIEVLGKVGTYRHAYTHFRVTLHAFCCQTDGEAQPQTLQVQDWRWVKPTELSNFPMGKIDRQISANLLEERPC